MNTYSHRNGQGNLRTQPSAETLDLTRQNVRDLLLQSPAFQSLPIDKQREIANHTVQIASYLAEPEGIRGDRLPMAQAASTDPYAVGFADPVSGARPGAQEGVFTAQAAREGAAVAGLLLQQVNFPSFVSGLISGVFHSIVQSSIEQMEAYGKLVADVAKTLNQFRDENVSANQGRDHLVEQFPDLFQVDIDTGLFDGGGGPRVRLRDGVDEDTALKRVNNLPIEGGPISSLDDETVEEKLVPAARTQLATSRQQLLATMVLMGINRIVVTDGKISAKVMYDFQARDNFQFRKSATQFDYAKDDFGNVQTVRSGQRDFEEQSDRGGYTYNYEKGKGEIDSRGGSYYAKGTYKYTDQPVVTLMSASQQATDAALQTKASLAGVVEVNFKSDYLPLEKMADSFQVAMIQDAAQPKQGARGAGIQQAPTQPPAQPPTQTPRT
ncbi:hypothetical protein H6F89_14195 [Cyanobacteria bacterium FACHB-63]|nr:hypothetical protein [Cyanobacteria bacterium FACHB-63]